MNIVRPTLTVLTSEQKDQIHRYSLDILATVGIRVDSEPGRRLFARATGRTADDGRVLLPAELVESAIESAPSVVPIYNRRGELAFCLGDDRPRFGIGVTALYYQDPLTDQVTPFQRAHMAMMARLGNALSSYDVISTVGIVQDVPPAVSDLYATLDMVANTTKSLVVLISEDNCFRPVLDLVEYLQGDLAAQPFVIPYVNPITPLVLNRGTVDKMLVAIERGLPVIFSNYGMVGATTPITPAGTLALLNAELLAGLVLSQLARPGAPIILGNLPAFFDMRGMGNFYDPLSYLLNLACAEMMVHYRLPHCGTSGSGMGWGADLIASGHQWMNHLTTCLGKIGLAPFVGDNLASKAFSPTVIVYANEVIAQARRLVAGFALDQAPMLLDEIGRAEPGGSFLTSPATLRGFRKAYYSSAIFPNLTLESWQAMGQPQAVDLLRRTTRDLIESAPRPDDHDDLLARGQAWIADL